MGIVRDQQWDEFYKSSNPKDPEEIRIKYTNALWKAKKKMDEIRIHRKKRAIKILKEVPKQTNVHKTHTSNICQSLTLSGKPCQFKAVSSCGRFCKKHNIE